MLLLFPEKIFGNIKDGKKWRNWVLFKGRFWGGSSGPGLVHHIAKNSYCVIFSPSFSTLPKVFKTPVHGYYSETVKNVTMPHPFCSEMPNQIFSG